MTDNSTLTLIQQVYFDICDLSYGHSYQYLGYENKKEFLKEIKEKLENIQMNLEVTA